MMSMEVKVDWLMVLVIVVGALMIWGVVSPEQLGGIIEKAKGLVK